MFQVHSVDSSVEWIEKSKELFPSEHLEIVKIKQSPVIAGTFLDRACHYYKFLPDIVPDFVYLDGPDPADVVGEINGLTWRNFDRVVMSADILRMETTFLPGTMILVDGRTANARFLAKNLYRNWLSAYDSTSDVTVFELRDKPLGSINRDTLVYCLGNEINHW
jgi:hypothetical protein